MTIPVTVTHQKLIGKVESIQEVEGNYGTQVQVVVAPANPEAVTNRLFWFKPSDKGNSKWMKFVNAFNSARAAAVQGSVPVQSVDELVNAWVEIEELPRSGVVQGEQRDWTEPVISHYFATEEGARNTWAAQNNVEAPPEVPATPATPPDVPASTVPPPIAATLKNMLAKSGKPLPVFYATEVASWGYTLEQVAEAVK